MSSGYPTHQRVFWTMASPVTTNGADLFKNRKILTKAGLAETVDQEPESRVLVLYTGGTIGMKTNPNGVYEPKAKFLINELKKLPMFHDEDYAKRSFSDDEVATLVMPLGLKLPYVPTVDNLDDEHRSRSLSIERVTKCGRRVKYVIKEYDPLLDSSNMNMQDWSKIAIDISMLYDEYDGFVVLHGTDTMAYTASALSFMFENLGKPIILTGSQIPIFEVRSDGRDNFLSSLIMAGHYCIPEVMVCFDNKLFRGNRTIKNDAGSFAAFISPNMAPIACLEKDITVDWSVVYRSGATEKFRVTTEMCVNVGLLRMFPGITSQTVRAFLMPPMQGVVLQSFGTGNAPDNRPDLLKVFEEAANIGIIIINITQCTKGYVDAAYATGKALYDTGVIPGGDMTPEAALTKLSYILAKPWTIDKKKKVMKKNLRGEVRIIKKEEEAKMDSELIENIADTLSLSTKEEIQKLKNALYPNLMCSAAMHNDIEALEKLRSTGGDLSSANQDGRTALHVASREGHLRLVDYLLHWGASVHMKDHHDNTPLMDAIIGKQMSIITLLVKTGAHLTLHPVRIAMELCSAAARDEVPTLKAWRAAGADLNVEDYDKRTPLHVAVSTRSMNAVKYMLQNGAKWDQEDIFGNTAKNQAEKAKDKEILKLIKETKCEQQNEEED